MNKKTNPYNSRTNQHKCYKEDKHKLDKLFKLVRKAYYSDIDKLTINFKDVKEELEEEKKGYCDELWCITDYLNLCI